MRGTGYKDVMAENMIAAKAEWANRKQNTKPKMCWRCQKDKPSYGGHIKTFAGGPMKFICKDCLDEMKAKKA